MATQAWTLPVSIFVAVMIWFLWVQFSFSLILSALQTEPTWVKAFSSSGSALGTLGYLTPSTLLGAYLATYESAIGLALVILLLTFSSLMAQFDTIYQQLGELGLPVKADKQACRLLFATLRSECCRYPPHCKIDVDAH